MKLRVGHGHGLGLIAHSPCLASNHGAITSCWRKWSARRSCRYRFRRRATPLLKRGFAKTPKARCLVRLAQQTLPDWHRLTSSRNHHPEFMESNGEDQRFIRFKFSAHKSLKAQIQCPRQVGLLKGLVASFPYAAGSLLISTVIFHAKQQFQRLSMALVHNYRLRCR